MPTLEYTDSEGNVLDIADITANALDIEPELDSNATPFDISSLEGEDDGDMFNVQDLGDGDIVWNQHAGIDNPVEIKNQRYALRNSGLPLHHPLTSADMRIAKEKKKKRIEKKKQPYRQLPLQKKASQPTPPVWKDPLSSQKKAPPPTPHTPSLPKQKKAPPPPQPLPPVPLPITTPINKTKTSNYASLPQSNYASLPQSNYASFPPTYTRDDEEDQKTPTEEDQDQKTPTEEDQKTPTEEDDRKMPAKEQPSKSLVLDVEAIKTTQTKRRVQHRIHISMKQHHEKASNVTITHAYANPNPKTANPETTTPNVDVTVSTVSTVPLNDTPMKTPTTISTNAANVISTHAAVNPTTTYVETNTMDSTKTLDSTNPTNTKAIFPAVASKLSAIAAMSQESYTDDDSVILLDEKISDLSQQIETLKEQREAAAIKKKEAKKKQKQQTMATPLGTNEDRLLFSVFNLNDVDMQPDADADDDDLEDKEYQIPLGNRIPYAFKGRKATLVHPETGEILQGVMGDFNFLYDAAMATELTTLGNIDYDKTYGEFKKHIEQHYQNYPQVLPTMSPVTKTTPSRRHKNKKQKTTSEDIAPEDVAQEIQVEYDESIHTAHVAAFAKAKQAAMDYARAKAKAKARGIKRYNKKKSTAVADSLGILEDGILKSPEEKDEDGDSSDDTEDTEDKGDNGVLVKQAPPKTVKKERLFLFMFRDKVGKKYILQEMEPDVITLMQKRILKLDPPRTYIRKDGTKGIGFVSVRQVVTHYLPSDICLAPTPTIAIPTFSTFRHWPSTFVHKNKHINHTKRTIDTDKDKVNRMRDANGRFLTEMQEFLNVILRPTRLIWEEMATAPNTPEHEYAYRWQILMIMMVSVVLGDDMLWSIIQELFQTYYSAQVMLRSPRQQVVKKLTQILRCSGNEDKAKCLYDASYWLLACRKMCLLNFRPNSLLKEQLIYNDFTFLKSLPGVGLKVVLMLLKICFDFDYGIAVDRHVFRGAIAIEMAVASMTEDEVSKYMKQFFHPQDYHKVNLVFAGCAQGLNVRCREMAQRDPKLGSIKEFRNDCRQHMIMIACKHGFGEQMQRFLQIYA